MKSPHRPEFFPTRVPRGADFVNEFPHLPQARNSLPTSRFQEMLKGTASGVDVLTGRTVDLTRELRLAPKATALIELPGA